MNNGWSGALLYRQLWETSIPAWAMVLPLVILLLLGLVVRRSLRRADDGYDASADRFAPTAPISEDGMALLHYLQQVFPHEEVLFQPSLSRFMMVRKCRDRRLSHARLAHMQVDFLVCREDGQPWIAFDVDQRLRDGLDEGHRLLEEKSVMLHSAGIRLIRLKGAFPTRCPPQRCVRVGRLPWRFRWLASARPEGRTSPCRLPNARGPHFGRLAASALACGTAAVRRRQAATPGATC